MKIWSNSVVLGLALTGCSVSPTSTIPEPRITSDDYAAAEKLLSQHLQGKVKNDSPEGHWLDSQDKFWYQRDSESGLETILVDVASGKRQDHYEPDQPKTPPQIDPGAVPSPDGIWSAFSQDYNLWIRHNLSGEERQLTEDGAEYFAYGAFPDQYRLDALRAGTSIPFSMASTYWSPDGKYLVVGRLNERNVPDYHFLESVPPSGSTRVRDYKLKVPLLGESGQRIMETFVFDISSGEQQAINLPSGVTLNFFATQNAPIAWSMDSSRAYFLGATEGDKEVHLLEVDMVARKTHSVLVEKTESSVSLGHNLRSGPNVRFLWGAQEVIWFSEQDGWGHLYLRDLKTGALKNRITSGDWTVFDIVHIDEVQRLVYFTAGGRESGSDPYYGKLYRASLDSSTIHLLTPEETNHDIRKPFSPNGKYFIEAYSSVDTASTSVVRSTNDGQIVTELETADADDLYKAGWRAPDRVKLKSADGVTDIWAAIYYPHDFDPQRSYPIIDAVYGGPVAVVAPRSFRQTYDSGYQQASLARLGFIVVVLDGRGTPYRSREFREAGYGNFADPQLEDHVAAIRQLAERIPSVDLERVGIYGHSNGGYMAARAMLKYPEVFKVGVSSAGPHNFHGLPGTGMPWMGIPDYGDGVTVSPNDAAVPANYRVLDNAEFASGLQGDLLLICGDMDNTAFPALTLQLADALSKANKSFDMLYLANQNHRYFIDEPYVIRRMWDYFVEHLHGTTPPINYEMMDYPTPRF